MSYTIELVIRFIICLLLLLFSFKVLYACIPTVVIPPAIVAEGKESGKDKEPTPAQQYYQQLN